MKRFIICVLLCLLLLFTLVIPSFCAENKTPAKQNMLERAKKAFSDLRQRYQKKEEKNPEPQPIQPVQKANPPTPAAKTPEKEMTKEEMVSEIKDILTEEDEISGLIQGLKAQKDPAGKVSYSYNGVGLENISKDELSALLNRARQMATKLRTERIQNQIEAVRQVDRLKGVSQPRTIALPASPPRPPSAPSQPPSAPRTPPPPAQPPRR